VYYAQHDFVPALDLAQQVYEKNSKNVDALTVIGDAQLALGNYQEADLAYQQLREQSNTPPVLARLAAFEELKGNPQQALDLMRRAASDALESGGTRESVAWYVLRVGRRNRPAGTMKLRYESSTTIIWPWLAWGR
jgi:tetratricopeptide (TPR) repeat protein